jgi:hypothetical protein
VYFLPGFNPDTKQLVAKDSQLDAGRPRLPASL